MTLGDARWIDDPSRRRAVLLVALVALLAVAAWGISLWRSTESALEREQLDAIDDRADGTGDGPLAADDELVEVLNVLVVGSDSREGLSAEDRRRLSTGDFDSTLTDSMLLFHLTPDGVSVVSFPRDLKVQVDDSGPVKMNSLLQSHGADTLVRVVEDALGIEVDHYVQVAIPSFLDIVDAVGGVEVCLDEPLRDRKSGADFDAGCHEMDGVEALSFVRSRSGDRGDYARVERQQTFLSALASRATSLSVLTNPLRLRSLVTETAAGLTVDEGLSVGRMIDLARALRGPVSDGLHTTTLPSWSADENDVNYVFAYPPGVEALSAALRSPEPLRDRRPADERLEMAVGLSWDGAPAEAGTIESVLFFLGYHPRVQGAAPEELAVTTTTVFHRPGAEDEAAEVASVLGAETEPVPPGAELPDGIDVLVVASDRPTTTVGGVLLPPA